ncbi:MAG: hypothetical protein ACJAZP_001547 [Psychromonas sp.]|jgi:hypothetical protein|uniref:hypothetical protein n=1 Tax=Psychromonas sp. TaxID=1884585 RepID=UPI0039E50FE9
MNINRISTQICSSIFLFALSFQAHAAAATTDNKSSFIELGAGYTVSDNIYKSADNEKTGSSATADMELGYKNKLASTDITLNYYTEYTKENAAELEDNNYWTGNALISQQVFSKNLLFNLAHTRQRYLIDLSQADNEDNQNEKDLLDAGLKWFIPYSPRTSFVAGVNHTETWYAGDTSTSDYNTNEGQFSWQYALTEKIQVEIEYSGSKKMFDNYDDTYTEHNLGTRLTQSYRLGTYSVNLGKTWVNGLTNTYDGEYYGLTANAEIRRHLFTFNASRTLTNSSTEVGTDDSTSSNENQLFWYTTLSLEHRYIMLDDKLITNLRFYYNNNDQVATLDGTDIDTYIKDKYGAFGELTWSLTESLSSSLSVDYYKSDLSTNEINKFTETEVSAKYYLTKSLYIQLSAAFKKLDYTQSSSGYEEQYYTSRIAYRY